MSVIRMVPKKIAFSLVMNRTPDWSSRRTAKQAPPTTNWAL